MKRQLLTSILLALAVLSCGKKEEQTTPLMVDFTISSNPCFAKEEVTFTANVSGGQPPYTCEWKVGDAATLSGATASWTSETNGTYVVVLKATDAKGNTGERSKNLVVNPAQVSAQGEVKVKWVGELEGYTAMTTPAVADDGSVYTATRNSNKLYKFSKDGAKVWEKDILVSPKDGSLILGTPAIDTDGTVYIGGGTQNGDGVLVAFKPDGSIKWRFKDFFATEGSTLAPAIQGVTAGIGDNNVYIGNTGTSGSILSVSKADGKRINYLKNSAGGGPAGGARAGILISKGGYLHWSGGLYGIFGAKMSALDTAGDGVAWDWSSFYASGAITNAKTNANATLAAMEVGGKPALVGMMTDNREKTKVYALDAATGAELAVVDVDECNTQDQGGVAVTGDGLIVAALKYTLGHDDGGIALVDPAQSRLVSHYRVMENVSGAPAVDAAGNIHFATESGNYYVVKPSGSSFETIVKKDIAELVRTDDRYAGTFKDLYKAKIWSGIVIGDDGTVYIQFTENELRIQGGIAAITVDVCTGPSTSSPWPMMGQNRRHTNRQQ